MTPCAALRLHFSWRSAISQPIARRGDPDAPVLFSFNSVDTSGLFAVGAAAPQESKDAKRILQSSRARFRRRPRACQRWRDLHRSSLATRNRFRQGAALGAVPAHLGSARHGKGPLSLALRDRPDCAGRKAAAQRVPGRHPGAARRRAAADREPTRSGAYLDEIGTSADIAAIEAHYLACLGGKVWIREASLAWTEPRGGYLRYSVLMLPLSEDGATVSHLIGLALYEF
jgi:hypothetical protein